MAMDVGASHGKKGQAAPEMNVTPLVDVVLVLLIIFMVITPMMNANFWINIPRKNRQEQQQEEFIPPDPSTLPVVVSVTPEGAIRINRDVVPDEEFSGRLRRVLAARADRKVFFDASDQAPYARAVEVMDMARGGGAAHIAVMTDSLQ